MSNFEFIPDPSKNEPKGETHVEFPKWDKNTGFDPDLSKNESTPNNKEDKPLETGNFQVKKKEEEARGALLGVYGDIAGDLNKTLEEQAKDNDDFIKRELKRLGKDPAEFERRAAKLAWQNKTLGQKASSIFKGLGKKLSGK